jgi:NAD+ diphosphatase
MDSPSERANVYSGHGLDRAHQRRGDSDWLESRLVHAESRIYPLWRSHNLVSSLEDPRASWLNGAQAASLVAAAADWAFLGMSDSQPHFAIDLTPLEKPEEAAGLSANGTFVDLRQVGAFMAPQEAALLAYARGLIYWHQRHRHCGLCGAPTLSVEGGYLRRCSDAACATPQFPRTDPAVIMLVHDGRRCVLGRQKKWPPGLYSTLAGFVEPGESLEEAVIREVREEAGLEVERLRYRSSQPWPFPSSLMVGFHALARYGPITIDREELADARWFTKAELLAAPEDERLRLPRRDSIARQLIVEWLED